MESGNGAGRRYGWNAPGGECRSVVWVERLVRRGRFEGRPIECIIAGAEMAEAERVKEFSIDSGISFREPGNFAEVWSLYAGREEGREIFLSSYSATKAFKVGRMVRNSAKPLGAGPRA